MSYSQSRARYAEGLDVVVDDREEVVITPSRARAGCVLRWLVKVWLTVPGRRARGTLKSGTSLPSLWLTSRPCAGRRGR